MKVPFSRGRVTISDDSVLRPPFPGVGVLDPGPAHRELDKMHHLPTTVLLCELVNTEEQVRRGLSILLSLLRAGRLKRDLFALVRSRHGDKADMS